MEYDDRTQQTQFDGLRTALNAQKFSDITFLIGPKKARFALNRMFLAMISPVFESMLYGQSGQTNGAQRDTEVLIEDLTPDIFEVIVRFAYCNDPQITSKNVLPVLTACDKYHIVKLQALCLQFLRSDLSDNNFNSYRKSAEAMQLNSTEINSIDKVLRFITDYFADHFHGILCKMDFCVFFDDLIRSRQRTESVQIQQCLQFLDKADSDTITAILESESFDRMSMKSMRLFLERPLDCAEDKIWESVVKWAARSKSDVHGVKDLIRFPAMNGKYFVQNVVPRDVLTKDEGMLNVQSFALLMIQ